MESGHTGVQPLTHGTAHQQIPCVGDQGDDGHFQIGSTCGDQGESSIFSCRSIAQKACQKALEWSESCVFGGNPQGKRYGKIAQSNGDAVPHSVLQGLPAVLCSEDVGFV